METLGLYAGFEATGRDADFELTFHRQLTPQVFDQDLILSHDQHLGHGLVFEVAKRHPVFFQELDQVFAGNATVLRAGDTVAFEATGIEPLADRAGGHFTDLRDLSSSEDLHRRLSSSLSCFVAASLAVRRPRASLGPRFVLV